MERLIKLRRRMVGAREIAESYMTGKWIVSEGKKKNWDVEKSTNFLESVLSGYPTGEIVLSNRQEGIIILDGVNRIRTLVGTISIDAFLFDEKRSCFVSSSEKNENTVELCCPSKSLKQMSILEKLWSYRFSLAECYEMSHENERHYLSMINR